MLTLALGLLAAGGYGVGDFFSMRMMRTSSVLTTLVWVLVVGSAVAVPLALVTGGLPHTAPQWAAAGRAGLGGVLYIAAFACLLAALRHGNLSVVSPISALGGALAAIVTISLGERLGTVASVSLAVAAVGGLLAAFEKGTRTASGALWALLGALFSGLGLLLFGSIGTTISPLMTVAASRLVSLAIVVPIVAFVRPPRPGPGLRRDAWLCATLETCGYLAAAAALMRGPVAVASVMITQFPIFGVLLGLFVLRERPARHQLAGVLLTIVAVTALSAAG